jgi:uncharacterized repeat protein (TIGR01451 family)
MLTLHVTHPVQPANDEIATATLIGNLPYATSEDTTGATSNPIDPVPTCGFNNGKTVWFRYVAGFTGTLAVDTLTTDYTPVLAAYHGTPSSSSQIGCVYGQPSISIQVTSGETYYFEAASYYSGRGGTLTLHAYQPSVLSVLKSHAGEFTQGQQNAIYKVTVRNASGAASTNGTVTVSDSLPTGLALVSMAGTGWSCYAASCSRSDPLAGGSSYPSITVTVNVAADAPSLYNVVTANGGGSQSVSVSDYTTIRPAGLTLSVSTGDTFYQGSRAPYTIYISNPLLSG